MSVSVILISGDTSEATIQSKGKGQELLKIKISYTTAMFPNPTVQAQQPQMNKISP